MRARWALVAAGVLAGALTSTDALAFCRSTTCSGDCPRDADGCKTTGIPLSWATSCVGFSVQRDASSLLPVEETKQVIRDAFFAWTDLSCATGTATLTFAELAETSCRDATFSASGGNANVIAFQENKWDYVGVDNNIAKTTVTFDKDSGEILDADIELNQAFNELTVGDGTVVYDVASIVTHEIGHFVGLDHSADFDATMYASYEPGSTTQRTLEADDVDGICTIYPPERVASCDPTPHGGLATSCGGCSLSAPASQSPAPLFAGLLLAMALRGRRLRAAHLAVLRRRLQSSGNPQLRGGTNKT